MIRLVFSFVFAFSILTAASSHASMLPKSLEPSIQVEAGHGDVRPCKTITTASFASHNAPCIKMALQGGNSLHCQVDVAPLVERRVDFNSQRQTKQYCSYPKALAEWLTKPVLGPPRLA